MKEVRRRQRRLALHLIGVAAVGLLAIPTLTAQRSDLRPNDTYRGLPWIGAPPFTITVAELMEREAGATPVARTPRARRREQADGELQRQQYDPEAPAVPRWPLDGDVRTPESASFHVGFNITRHWLGPRLAESGFLPADSNGAVGATQVLVTANGRFRLYDKNGIPQGFDVSDDTFWSAVVTPTSGSFVSDPHVRYDRLSNRWFITEVEVPPCECSNRILIAVSSGPTIAETSSFTLYSFQHDVVGPTPNSDTGGFADFATLGVDAYALYIGVNEFSAAGFFLNTTGYVVNKAALLFGDPLVVTAFRQLLNPSTFSGPFAPQGVDNDDPAATEGYFIGINAAAFSQLAMRRVSNPGGAPAISGTIIVAVPSTSNPIPQAALGSTRPLDAGDTRLYAAMIKKNKLTGASSLWTAHNIGVNASGVASVRADRNAGRWYEIDNLTTTPILAQAGTVFDPSPVNAYGFWINTIAANGQGHAAIGQSWAGPTMPPSVAVYSRNASDAFGEMRNGLGIPGVDGYNIRTGGETSQRWGDFSQVVVDPTDDMTLWSFQQYADAPSSWGVRAMKLQAPPPARPASASPPSLPRIASSVEVTITGTSSAGSGFFDPGPGFANRVSASVSGGVIVNSVTFVNPTTVLLNLSTAGAAPGVKDVTITNPDGQSLTGIALFTVAGVAGGSGN